MARRTKETTDKGWVNIDKDIKVIGTAERFSISFELDTDFIVGFNAMRIVDGRSGKFISGPAWKDKDGNFHNYTFLQLPKDLEDKIIEAVEK